MSAGATAGELASAAAGATARRGHRGAGTAVALAALIATLAGPFYLTRLASAPVYLAHDEVQFARQAHSLLTTGTDLSGRRRPLYFAEPHFLAGREPMSIYATAAWLSFHPLSTVAIRTPAAIVGVLNIILMFGLGLRVFKRRGLACVAAAILAMTPAHFVYSRFATDVVYPMPFAMLWLLGVTAYFERRTLPPLLGAAVALGVGMYSYLVATVLMPMYWLMTAAAVSLKRSTTTYVVLAAGLCVPIIPLLWWHLSHPERYADLISSYHFYDAYRFNALQGIKDVLSYFGLGVRLDTYWNCFNPGMLFFSGDSSIMVSTRQVGVFLLPMGVLLPLGLHHIWTKERTPFNLILVGGLLLAPIPSVMTAEVAVRRIILVLPFATLIATVGVQSLIATHRRWQQVVAVVLVGLMPFQFARFYGDYFGDHRQRSSYWFGGNILGGLDEFVRLEADPTRPPAYLSNAIWYVDEYLPYSLATAHREDLTNRVAYFDPRTLNPATLPPRTLLMVGLREPIEPLLKADDWRKVSEATDPNGSPSLTIYERR